MYAFTHAFTALRYIFKDVTDVTLIYVSSLKMNGNAEKSCVNVIGNIAFVTFELVGV